MVIPMSSAISVYLKIVTRQNEQTKASKTLIKKQNTQIYNNRQN